MAYFSKFPVLEYPFFRQGSAVRSVFVRNLLRRVALSDNIKDGVGTFLTYDIKDGERPEHIADRVYGDPGFHWIILLCNNIIDPYHDWYKSGAALDEYLQKKYSGYSVYITKTDNTLLFDANLTVGCTLSQGFLQSKITSYSPSFCRVVVPLLGFTEGSATITLADSTTVSVTIHRVDKELYSVNEFRVNKGAGDIGESTAAVVDPLTKQDGSYELPNGVVGSVENTFPSITAGVDYAGSGTVDLWETFIGKYMGIVGDPVGSFAVSNLTYEMEKNDAKRTIKILDPRFKGQAVSELETLLGV